MTKVNARTSLSKCSTVSARISQNRSVWKIYHVDAIALASQWFLISSFVRRNFQGNYLIFFALHNKLLLYASSSLHLASVARYFTVFFPIPYKIVTIHRTLSEHTFLSKYVRMIFTRLWTVVTAVSELIRKLKITVS